MPSSGPVPSAIPRAASNQAPVPGHSFPGGQVHYAAALMTDHQQKGPGEAHLRQAAHRDERDLLPRRRHGAHRCGRRTASPAKMAEVSVPGRARRATGPDVRAAGMAGADIVRAAQARVTSMATGTGLVTMSRTGE